MDNSSPSIEIYCTRPNCQDPITQISEERLAGRPVRQLHCINCGMPLIVEGRFLPKRLLVPDEEQGGFGRTFIAEDLKKHNSLCVIKQLHPRVTHKKLQLDVIQRLFEREANVLHRLNHSQIPRALEFAVVEAPPNLQDQFLQGSDNRQKFFYLMQDYIKGQNLAQELSQRRQFSEDEVLEILHQLLEVLKYVHSEGVIHRDIKPSNIMRCEADGRLYLIDFGAVKQVVVAGVPTEQSAVIGTKYFAPPEQQAGKAVSFSSDLYSLAATCVCLLTGRKPEKLRHEDRWNWRQYANVSDNFAGILDRMLLPEPEQRFQHAKDVITALSQEEFQPPEQEHSSSRSTKQHRQLVISPISKLVPPWLSQIPTFREPSSFFNQLKKFLKKRVLIVGAIFLGLAIALASPKIQSIIFPPPPPSPQEQPLSPNYFSRGEESLINQSIESSTTLCQQAFNKKTGGMQAFGAQNFQLAKDNFQTAINLFKQANLKCSVDPETLIFLNNAKANIKGNPLTIAVVVPFNESNEFRKLTEDVLRGVAHVQKNLNNQSNGIQGRLLQVIIARDDNDSSKAKRVAKHLAQKNIPGDRNFNGNILAVIGHYTSDVTLIAGEVYESKIVAVSPTSTAVRQSNSSSSGYKFNLSEYVFRTATNDSVAADDLFKYVQTIPGSGKGAILFNSQTSSYSQSLKEAFEKKFAQGNVVSCDLSKFRVHECVQQAQDAKFLMLALGAEEAATSNGLLAIQLIDRRKPLLGGDTLYNDAIFPLDDKARNANNVVLAVPSHVDVTTPAFKKESIQLWGTQYVGWGALTAYDATQTIVEALKKQGNNPSRPGLYNVLNDPNFSTQGATGKVQFDAQHDRKVNPEDDNKLGVLVRVQRKCKPDDKNDNYKFCLLEQQ
ncbi:protein kinase domain-containing protein [Scytonema sp. PCC 10023]|uniref:bifunctional serine/threonine-protein kinase/ABC transporter substrate-binding protein n=1 Tax=Scytonema sp. PCC 10023 TaxID=1680591 RepID=UPI0039C74E16